MRKIILLIVATLFPLSCLAGTKVIDYGFEDFNAWNGSVSPANGYIFSTSAEAYFLYHVRMCNVINNASSAYAGNYYFHRQFCVNGQTDSLLVNTTTPTTDDYIDDRGNIGYNLTYPTGTKDTTALSSAITTDTLVIRFYARTNGNWKTNSNEAGGAMNWAKLVWVRGADATTDNGSNSVFYELFPGNFGNTYTQILDPSDWSNNQAQFTDDLLDGEWHAYCFKTVRNNDTGQTGNITASMYIDDWDMANAPASTDTITCSTFGATFSHFTILTNFGNTFPTAAMGIDLDKIEVWDGLPDESTTSSPGIRNSSIRNATLNP